MMNIGDDYLWDQTGEPDPEIQQLEQMLGSLRYQPRSLDIPGHLAPGHKRAFFPRFLAIAATITMMLLGVGLWFGLQRHQTNEVSKVPNKPVTTSGGNQTAVGAPNKDNGPAATLPAIDRGDKSIRHRLNRDVLSREPARNRRPAPYTAELSARDRREGEAAKEQLMLAMRVASLKLSFAQKKAQEINSANLTHNQHKIG
jgi:hypothetical protein